MNHPSEPKLRVLEVAHLGYTLLKTISVASLALVTAPFRGQSGHQLYFKHVAHTALRTLNGNATAREIQAMNPSSVEAYRSFAIAHGFEPNIIDLPATSGKLLWLGNPKASNVLIFFHGGGYVYPATTQLQWCWDLKERSNLRTDLAVAFLAYSLAPSAQYPVQLSEAVDLLRYLTGKEGKNPSKIVIAGDSAGGQLGLGVVSHLLHPHPSIEPLMLSSPLAGLALVSPWTGPTVTAAESAKRNAHRDVVNKAILEKWGAYAVGSATQDEYNAPLTANQDWWSGILTVVKAILVIGGTSEVLFDDITAFVDKLKPSVPELDVVYLDETHDPLMLDPILHIKEECESSKVAKSWVISKLQ
ncbi:alpha/beta-hydrolase [Xylaria sp. FL0064]|nr:alpha/beta-hydrolase [Xylaria sp. FL0064]